VSAFYDYSAFHSLAKAAPTNIASTNSGAGTYKQVFSDLTASASANNYMGMHTLSSYDANACAAYCDQASGCKAFNLFIERDPSLNPTANDNNAPTVWGTWCPNPASITNYKCTLWGSSFDQSAATNQGGWREQFQVAITGSDAWTLGN